ncbi:hypothetical protein [Clostridium thermobutyricum]|uniref:hypothetical protein n=1 Tax=Clostridium thermobutyricum TaxID=29372 RepID=UPI0018A8EDFE|nr:hypothetical protein [Clostridium thermobutyricum]
MMNLKKYFNKKKSLIKKLLLATGNTITINTNDNIYELKKINGKCNDIVVLKDTARKKSIKNEYINIDLANCLIDLDTSLFIGQNSSIKIKLIGFISGIILSIFTIAILFSIIILNIF